MGERLLPNGCLVFFPLLGMPTFVKLLGIFPLLGMPTFVKLLCSLVLTYLLQLEQHFNSMPVALSLLLYERSLGR